jgi:long-chain fatty acid transport protein
MSKLSLLFVAAGSGVASGNAFNLNEHDARSTGRGDAVTATDTEPSSIAYNPGGIAVGEGTQILIGGSLILAHGKFTNLEGDEFETENHPQVIPQIFIVSRVHELLSVGIGVHTPFGLSVNWPEGSPQNNIVKYQALQDVFITPAVGINLTQYVPGLTIGGGVDIVPASVELRQEIFFGDTTGQAHLGGTAVGIGGRVGAMYRPEAVPELMIGAMWRSSVTLDFTGTGDFDIAQPFRSALPPDGTISTSITLPMSAQLGVAYRPIDNLEVELDGVWVQWSKFHSLDIQVPTIGNGTMTLSTPEDYNDTFTARVGVEYALPEYKAAVRAGYIFDPTPIPNTTLTAALPDADRHIVTAGGSYQLDNYTGHLGLLWVLPVSRQTSMEPFTPVFKGTYGIQALVISLSLVGQFGK